MAAEYAAKLAMLHEESAAIHIRKRDKSAMCQHVRQVKWCLCH